eukprot:TRINITY_DN10693_c0_g1_i1.p1 TRINITY_DN10693_c0_g1~~TRINITY_DN10693_c0_g1_i1.p1  ORF type:complete len:401 (-),score=36.45 TRINITY_DN10693_c0_g1_i1:26-1132(-)
MATTHVSGRRSRHFYSDNNSGIHPQVLEAIVRENSSPEQHVHGYGEDSITLRASNVVRNAFGGSDDIGVFFMWSGTGANVLAVSAVCRLHEAVICADSSHLYIDECGAPERHLGVKLFAIPSADGKITPEQVEQLCPDGDFHHSQPRLLSITQSTEYGTSYSIHEIKALADIAHKHNMYLHMDGARIYNAAAFLGCSLQELTIDAGVDILSLGGTKNGCMGAEAVVTFRPELKSAFRFLQKQAMQTPSKMRFVACQIEALFTNSLWQQNAGKANQMARLLRDKLEREVPSVSIAQKTEANSVWIHFPNREVLDFVQQEVDVCLWNSKTLLTRMICNFDTHEDDVEHLVSRLSAAMKRSDAKQNSPNSL